MKTMSCLPEKSGRSVGRRMLRSLVLQIVWRLWKTNQMGITTRILKLEEYAFITNEVIATEDRDVGLFIRALPQNLKIIPIISDIVRIAINQLTGPLNVAIFRGIIMLQQYQFLFRPCLILIRSLEFSRAIIL